MSERSESQGIELPQPWHALVTWLGISSAIVLVGSAGYLFATASGRIDAFLSAWWGEGALLLSISVFASTVFVREVLRNLPRRPESAKVEDRKWLLRALFAGVALIAFSSAAHFADKHLFPGRFETWMILARDATSAALFGCAIAMPVAWFAASAKGHFVRWLLLLAYANASIWFLSNSTLPFLAGRRSGIRWILVAGFVLAHLGIGFLVRKRKASHA